MRSGLNIFLFASISPYRSFSAILLMVESRDIRMSLECISIKAGRVETYFCVR